MNGMVQHWGTGILGGTCTRPHYDITPKFEEQVRKEVKDIEDRLAGVDEDQKRLAYLKRVLEAINAG